MAKTYIPIKKQFENYPLLQEGYDRLECPDCDKMCYPDAKRGNGTIVYTRHPCKSTYDLEATDRSFEINVDGELVGYP